MLRKPLVRKLFPIYLIINLISVLFVSLYASNASRELYLREIEKDLAVRTQLLRSRLIDEGLTNRSDIKLQEAIKSYSKAVNARITIISYDGTVLADSNSNPEEMGNHASRPEIIKALKGKTGISRRTSSTLKTTMIYVATPLEANGGVKSVLRIAMDANALDVAQNIVYQKIILGAILVALLAGIASWLAARRISGPLLEMKKTTADFANGNFKPRVPIPDTEEFATLAEALNRMAAQIDHQLITITRQAREQQAILSSMKEAVIAINNDDRILIINPAAAEMLNMNQDTAQGKTIQEAIRNPDLQNFFNRARAAKEPINDVIKLHGNEERVVQAVGSTLLDADNNKIGVLAVLNDITQNIKLENIRKEFVANVSHELKTPITSIKGFVETLREGAIRDTEKANEFLDIVARQADRLTSIIEDILSLSRIEQEAESEEIKTAPSVLKSVLESAIGNCKPGIIENNIELTLECDDNLIININAPLIEQAVTNLIDNAVKYSPGGKIVITAKETGGEVQISVADNGCGIEAEHLPRLFERFYRVDKARSRKLGGTGLGLAIVKHIVNAHHGKVGVESTPGKGSTFTIYLPIDKKKKQSSVV